MNCKKGCVMHTELFYVKTKFKNLPTLLYFDHLGLLEVTTIFLPDFGVMFKHIRVASKVATQGGIN